MTTKKLIFLFLSCLFFFLILQDSQISEIKSGHLSYTYNCGWIDWKHARPAGIKKFVDEFNHKFSQTALHETFKITYGQQGGFKIKNYLLYSYGISRDYEILKSTNEEENKQYLMFQIFKEVSFLFENQQKEIFGGLLKSSSFREGDLMGSLIGFYIATGELTKKQASRLCEEQAISISLQLKNENKTQINDSFLAQYHIVHHDKKPIFPEQLTDYEHLKNEDDCIKPLEIKRTISFFNNELNLK